MQFFSMTAHQFHRICFGLLTGILNWQLRDDGCTLELGGSPSLAAFLSFSLLLLFLFILGFYDNLEMAKSCSY